MVASQPLRIGLPVVRFAARDEPAADEGEGEAGEGEVEGEADGAWEQAANDALHVETRETVLEAVREGGAPPGRRPELRCRRVEPYGR